LKEIWMHSLISNDGLLQGELGLQPEGRLWLSLQHQQVQKPCLHFQIFCVQIFKLSCRLQAIN
jgi:hypothetical protein